MRFQGDSWWKDTLLIKPAPQAKTRTDGHPTNTNNTSVSGFQSHVSVRSAHVEWTAGLQDCLNYSRTLSFSSISKSPGQFHPPYPHPPVQALGFFDWDNDEFLDQFGGHWNIYNTAFSNPKPGWSCPLTQAFLQFQNAQCSPYGPCTPCIQMCPQVLSDVYAAIHIAFLLQCVCSWDMTIHLYKLILDPAAC